MDHRDCTDVCVSDCFPSWAKGLKRSGMYYEGIVENLDDVLEAHRRITMTTYGTRTSKKQGTFTEVSKENQNETIQVNQY